MRGLGAASLASGLRWLELGSTKLLHVHSACGLHSLALAVAAADVVGSGGMAHVLFVKPPRNKTLLCPFACFPR